MSDKKPDIKSLLAQANLAVEKARRFRFIMFITFVALIYGFVVFRINSLSNAQPSDDSVTSQVQAAQGPHIDKTVVKQLESLQDNSVNVQTLFNDARSNPFQ